MVADRVVALAGTRIGRRTVMGSGALCKRDTSYRDGETWIGNGATSYMAPSEMLTCSRKKTEKPYV